MVPRESLPSPLAPTLGLGAYVLLMYSGLGVSPWDDYSIPHHRSGVNGENS